MDDKQLTKLLGARFRDIRRLSGASQADVGETLGVTFQQVQKYEKGLNRMSQATVLRLAKFFGRPVSDFFDIGEEIELDSRAGGKTLLALNKILVKIDDQQLNHLLTNIAKKVAKEEIEEEGDYEAIN